MCVYKITTRNNMNCKSNVRDKLTWCIRCWGRGRDGCSSPASRRSPPRWSWGRSSGSPSRRDTRTRRWASRRAGTRPRESGCRASPRPERRPRRWCRCRSGSWWCSHNRCDAGTAPPRWTRPHSDPEHKTRSSEAVVGNLFSGEHSPYPEHGMFNLGLATIRGHLNKQKEYWSRFTRTPLLSLKMEIGRRQNAHWTKHLWTRMRGATAHSPFETSVQRENTNQVKTRLSSGKSAAFQLDGLCGLRDCMGCQ